MPAKISESVLSVLIAFDNRNTIATVSIPVMKEKP